jgi:alanine racemase
VKADAYGHGLVPVARALEEADGLGVAHISEAFQLREAGVKNPIVILEGAMDGEELQQAAMHSFAVVIHQEEQVEMLDKINLTRPLEAWLKLDTGMHRLGLSDAQYQQAVQKVKVSTNVSKLVVMSHLACADEADSEFTRNQINAFSAAGSGLMCDKSLANSAALLTLPETHFDWVRPGIALYGVSPIDGKVGVDFDLQSVMTLSSKIISVKEINEGDAVGYGASWIATRKSRIATIAIGYGDGYPRHVKSNTPVLVTDSSGKCVQAPIIGRVSMDMIAIDITEIPSAALGSQIILWGDELPVEAIAKCANTIPYELLCQICPRVEHLYVDGE